MASPPPRHLHHLFNLDNISSPLERIIGRQLVRGHGSVFAVMFDTPRTWVVSLSWNRELDLQHSRQ